MRSALLAFNPKDYYFHKAKAENYAARSAFKLEEIDRRFRLLRPGQTVLDLGAAPGSWSQYASKRVGANGRVIGIDLQAVKVSLANAVFVEANLLDASLPAVLAGTGTAPPFDIVLSDMAPKTTGVKITDQARSLELCEIALTAASDFLREGGSFVCKLFHGEDFDAFRARLRESFAKVEVLRPKSTRKESKEVFFIAIGFRARRPAPT